MMQLTQSLKGCWVVRCVVTRQECGIIRIKVNVMPPESTLSFIANYAQFLSISLTALNIEAKVHFAQEEKKQ